jgi:hypothetical protein
MNPRLPTSAEIIRLHDGLLSNLAWSEAVDVSRVGPLWRWIAVNHHNNFLLWGEEDLARRTTVDDSEIAGNKRRIDAFNQARNDATERVDELLLLELGLVDEAQARSSMASLADARDRTVTRLNSETAGSMIDRLSIVALKISAMRAQTLRRDVDQAHRELSTTKLERLIQQRNDLGFCFDELLAECHAGRAYFKVYRQFKMYNDPALNPALVAERAAVVGSTSAA